MDSYYFIAENQDYMWIDHGEMHCLLVACEDSCEGILVESEGSDYARYSAFVSDTSVFLKRKYHALEDMNSRLEAAVDSIIQKSISESEESSFYSLAEMSEQYGLSGEMLELAAEMLGERDEVTEMSFQEDGLTVMCKTGYYPQLGLGQ
jgi:hypothetical protein